MKKLIFILILCMTVTVSAVDTKVTGLAELTAVADADMMYIIDDIAGTATSKKITVLNLFDTIDTFAELNTIVVGKTLVNEEDAVTWDAAGTFTLGMVLSDGLTLTQSADNYLTLTENSDTLQVYFDATDVAILWSDGALTLRNAEDVDGVVQISGKDAGDKGILRVRSDGDDKYIELYHDDTDAVLTNSAGNIIINPVGLGIVIGDNGNEDYTLTFDGDTSDGVLNYDEDNADFEFDQDVITTGVFYAPAFDAVGAEDMDYGSADVTDHTFTTNDMTLIMDGGITVSTGDFIKIGTTQWNSADEIDGTKIKDADYGDVVIDAGGDWDVTAATLATTVTLGDDNATNDDQDIVFTTDAAGAANLEADIGDFYYNPSTGTVTATEFSGGGAGLTGTLTAYDDIADPDAAGSISFDAVEGATYTSSADEWVGVTISNTQADNAGDTELLTLAFTDDGDINSHYLIMSDAAGTQQLEVIQNVGDVQITTAGDLKFIAGGGDFNFDNDTITTTGTIEGATLTEGGNAVYSSGETPSGELGGTYANITIDDSVSVSSWSLTSPTFLTGITATDLIDSAHYAAGSIDYEHLADDVVSGAAAVGTFESGDTFLVLEAGVGLREANYDDLPGAPTAWDDIADPDAAATIDFVTYTQTIDIGVTDTGGPKSGLILDVTGLGAGVTDVIVLEITTAADDDADFIPIAIYDDSGVANDLLFKIDFDGEISTADGLVFLDNSARISAALGTNHIRFFENSDLFVMNFGGTDIDLIWNDGALNLRNDEDGIDAIVEIEGKDGGEKGILRVMSDGDDKYIELYHDDTDARIVSSSGSINLSSQTLTMPKRTSNDDRFYNFTIWNPSSIQSDDTQLCIDPNLPVAITITEVTVTCDADPTTELDWNLKWADAFIGLANAALIVAIDTTAGVADVDSGFTDATVAAGKCIYIEFDAAPDSATTQVSVKIRWDYD